LPTFEALSYARSLSTDILAVHVDADATRSDEMEAT
jgi:hypothetical protein